MGKCILVGATLRQGSAWVGLRFCCIEYKRLDTVESCQGISVRGRSRSGALSAVDEHLTWDRNPVATVDSMTSCSQAMRPKLVLRGVHDCKEIASHGTGSKRDSNDPAVSYKCTL